MIHDCSHAFFSNSFRFTHKATDRPINNTRNLLNVFRNSQLDYVQLPDKCDHRTRVTVPALYFSAIGQ